MNEVFKIIKELPMRWKIFVITIAVFFSFGGLDFSKDIFAMIWQPTPKMGAALELTKSSFEEMNRIRVATGAKKVLLLSAHNHGRPRPGTQMLSSVIYEVWGSGSVEIKDRWQNQPLDEPYILLLSKVFDSGGVHLITENMPDSILKNIYASQGISHAYVSRIFTTDKEIFYLSVIWGEEQTLDAAQLDAIRSGTTLLHDIIKKGEEL